MRRILLPEDEVTFKIVDIFSELNEKRTEFMRVNLNSFFGDSYLAEVRKNLSEGSVSPASNPRHTEATGKYFAENVQPPFTPKVRGTSLYSLPNPLHSFLARTNTCPLLKKVGSTIDLILGYCPISGSLFFPLLHDQLSVLERFLSTSTSRIVMSEAVEKVLQSLVSLKYVFIRLHDTEVRDTMNKTVSHRNSPRRYFREDKQGLPQSRGEPVNTNKYAPLTSVFSMRDRNLNPSRSVKTQSERNAKKISSSNLNLFFNKKNSLLFRNKDTFAFFLKVVGELQIRARKNMFFQPFLELFILDNDFEVVSSRFARGIFEEVIVLGAKVKASMEESGLFEEDAESYRPDFDRAKVCEFSLLEQKMFLDAKYILDYYKNQLLFCKLMIVERKLNDKSDPPSNEKKMLARKINMVISKFCELFDHQHGVLGAYVNSQIDLMSKLSKNNRFKAVKDVPSLAFNMNLLFNLFHSVFEVLALGFGIKFKYSDFMNETNVNHYIRMCYLNFVKIYSYISNAEIIKINQKVVRKLNEEKYFGLSKSKAPQAEELRSPPKLDTAHRKNSFPVILSKIYLRVVINIALCRNEAIKNIFFQFRVMEFFYKEIDLEFEISQIKERFIKIRNDVKDNISATNSPKKEFATRTIHEVDTPKSGVDESKRSRKDPHPLLGPQPGLPIGGFKLNLGTLPPRNNLKDPGQNQNQSFDKKIDPVASEKPQQKPETPQPATPGLQSLKLNLDRLAPKASGVPAVAPNAFNLDFSKIQNKQKPAIETPGSRAPSSQQPSSKPAEKKPQNFSEDSSMRSEEPPVQPPVQVVPGLGFKGIGKLNLGGVERGTKVDPPAFLPSGDDRSSSDSSEVHIDYDPRLCTPQKPALPGLRLPAPQPADRDSVLDRLQDDSSDELLEEPARPEPVAPGSRLPLPAFSPLQARQDKKSHLPYQQASDSSNSDIEQDPPAPAPPAQSGKQPLVPKIALLDQRPMMPKGTRL